MTVSFLNATELKTGSRATEMKSSGRVMGREGPSGLPSTSYSLYPDGWDPTFQQEAAFSLMENMAAIILQLDPDD